MMNEAWMASTLSEVQEQRCRVAGYCLQEGTKPHYFQLDWADEK